MAAASSATSSTTSASIAFDIIIDLGLGRGGLLAAVDAENAASGGITHLDDDFWGCMIYPLICIVVNFKMPTRDHLRRIATGRFWGADGAADRRYGAGKAITNSPF